jgi:hypothetical protein
LVEQRREILGCNDVEARLAVEALAGLHGPRWCDPEWLSFDGVTMPQADADVARGMGQLAHIALDTTLSGLGDRISAPDRAILTESADPVERWLGINPERFCLLHGDYRLDNLLFDPDKTSVTVVDWQTITVGLLARDLAYFLGTSLDSDLREKQNPSWSRPTIGVCSTMELPTMPPRNVGTAIASECCRYRF